MGGVRPAYWKREPKDSPRGHREQRRVNCNDACVLLVPLTPSFERRYPDEAAVKIAGKPGKAMADQIIAII